MVPLTPFSPVERFGYWFSSVGTKGALEEDTLEIPVAAKNSTPRPACGVVQSVFSRQ
jgi:hypothetical protein